MHNNSNIICPCCSSTNTSLKYKISAQDSSLHIAGTTDYSKQKKIAQIIEDIWKSDYTNWIRCKNCGFEFANPFIAGTPEYYSIAYTGGNYYTEWKWDYEITLNVLKKIANLESKFLEIGAGNGSFVARLKNNIISADNILCTEYSEYGVNNMQLNGINCIKGDISKLSDELKYSKFNIICMFQVLEHMDNFDVFFETINKISANKCNLFIAVPNNKQRNLYDCAGMKLDLPPTHISRFTPQSIALLAQKFNWELVESRYQPTKHIQQTLLFISEKHQQISFYRKIGAEKNKNRLLFYISLLIVAFMNIFYLLKLNVGKKGVSQWFWLRKL